MSTSVSSLLVNITSSCWPCAQTAAENVPQANSLQHKQPMQHMHIHDSMIMRLHGMLQLTLPQVWFSRRQACMASLRSCSMLSAMHPWMPNISMLNCWLRRLYELFVSMPRPEQPLSRLATCARNSSLMGGKRK